MGLALPSKHKKGQPTQYVAFIVLCKGIPFYGYHVGYVTYLKVYIVHPRHKTRLSEVLRSGAVFGTPFDVFEAHVPFLLQFMLDANLFGCGWVEVGKCLFREDVPGTRTRVRPPFSTPEHFAETFFAQIMYPPLRTSTTRHRAPARTFFAPIARGRYRQVVFTRRLKTADRPKRPTCAWNSICPSRRF